MIANRKIDLCNGLELYIGLLRADFSRYFMCADIGIRLDREEDLICPAEEWSDAVAAQGNVFPAPKWLNIRPIDVRDVSYSFQKTASECKESGSY